MFLEDVEDVWFSDEQHPPKADLVDISDRPQGDLFSRWFTYTAVPWLHKHVFQRPRHLLSRRSRTFTDPKDPKQLEASSSNMSGRLPSSRTFDYDARTLEHITETVSLVLSSLMPTVTIFALYYIPQEQTIWRLVFILVLSAIFATALAIFTTARRIEIFAGVATLASIQVVFIGTHSGTPGI